MNLPQTILGFPAMNVLLVAAVAVVAYLLAGKNQAGPNPHRFRPAAKAIDNANQVDAREKRVDLIETDLEATAQKHAAK